MLMQLITQVTTLATSAKIIIRMAQMASQRGVHFDYKQCKIIQVKRLFCYPVIMLSLTFQFYKKATK